MVGVRLMVFHPEVAYRSCDDCKKWLYDASGDIEKFGNGVKKKRVDPSTTPCWNCPKQPDGVPAAMRCPQTAVNLLPEVEKIYRHYQECRAVNHFPDDDLVRRNAMIIRSIMDAADQRPMQQLMELFVGILRR